MTKSKFSDLVIELSEVWILWMKNNAICKDEKISIKARKDAADICENLNDRRNNIVEELDCFFPS